MGRVLVVVPGRAPMNRRRSRKSAPMNPPPWRFIRKNRSVPCKVPTLAALDRAPRETAPTESKSDMPRGEDEEEDEVVVPPRPNICPTAAPWPAQSTVNTAEMSNRSGRMAGLRNGWGGIRGGCHR